MSKAGWKGKSRKATLKLKGKRKLTLKKKATGIKPVNLKKLTIAKK